MGGWLSALLLQLGAEVTGYALSPSSEPNLFGNLDLSARLAGSTIADIRDYGALSRALHAAAPQIVFHLAAQPLVRRANAEPIYTYDVNVMGTAKLLEAVRQVQSVRAVVVVTTDKVYLNRNWVWPYRETDRLGGHEPYSSSKACAEHVVDAYRHVFYGGSDDTGVGLATVRAGNIIGGGDWAADRLVPDAIRAFSSGQPLILRRPEATRPWQHVLDPLPGYLMLAEKLLDDPAEFGGAWNFGPPAEDAWPVGKVAAHLADGWGEGAIVSVERDERIFEEQLLALDSAKAQYRLGWRPRWRLQDALRQTIDWYRAHSAGEDMKRFTDHQIAAYLAAGIDP